MAFMPTGLDMKCNIQRTWFFNTLSTVLPGYVQTLVKRAQDNRELKDPEKEDAEIVECSEAWLAKIKESTFSSKKKYVMISIV